MECFIAVNSLHWVEISSCFYSKEYFKSYAATCKEESSWRRGWNWNKKNLISRKLHDFSMVFFLSEMERRQNFDISYKTKFWKQYSGYNQNTMVWFHPPCLSFYVLVYTTGLSFKVILKWKFNIFHSKMFKRGALLCYLNVSVCQHWHVIWNV